MCKLRVLSEQVMYKRNVLQYFVTYTCTAYCNYSILLEMHDMDIF